MAKLYCIIAREADCGVIFRRGPSRHVALIKWDLKANQFERGQWFKGNIYERKSDLSPDGSKLAYFAAKYHYGAELQTWIAVSTPPYFTAHVLWKTIGTYVDISLFTANNSLSLAVYSNDSVIDPYEGFTVPKQLRVKRKPWPGHFYITPEHDRLIRDGWFVQSGDPVYHGANSEKNYLVIYRKYLMPENEQVYLEMAAKSSGNSLYKLCNANDNPIILNANWADFHCKNVYFSSGGVLLQVPIYENGGRFTLGDLKQLADFSEMKFEELEAPSSALMW